MKEQPGLFTPPAEKGRAAERQVVPEIVTSEPASLQLYRDGDQEVPPAAALAMMEKGVEIAQRMAQVVTSLRKAGITMTDPVDWVLNKDKQGNEVGMLTASGAQKVASLYGIGLEPQPGSDLEPVRRQLNNKLAFTLQCTAFSRLLGREIPIEATRREDEEFTGREVDTNGEFKYNGGAAFEPDLKKSVRTLAITTAVRELVGLKNVSRRELDEAWIGSGKTTERCRFGHGYGTSNERSAAGVAEGDVPALAEALRVELLKRTNGDESAAKDLLKEITADKDGKYAKASTKAFTQGWQVEAAWKKLKVHKVFGDAAQAAQREPGE